MNSTKTLHGLPPLAGICSFEEAERTAMSVDVCVGWIKRHHYLLVRLHEIFTARITAEPIYELKTAFGLHAYLCAEHATAYRQRVSELREPPLGLEVIPHLALKRLCDEVLCSPTHVELVLGLYEVIVPALIKSLTAYNATTNPLADAPSVRVTRFCLIELNDMAAFGKSAIDCLVSAKDRERRGDWLGLLDECLVHVGCVNAVASSGFVPKDTSPRNTTECSHGTIQKPHSKAAKANELPIDTGSPVAWISEMGLSTERVPIQAGQAPAAEASAPNPQFSKVPFVYDPVPKRDDRFQDSYNAGVNPESFLYDERFAARDKVLMMFYKRLREIDVPEMMASIVHQTPGKPWKYYRDMSRQLWDEARHAMLGEVGFRHLGLDWTRIPINFTWSKNLNTQLEPWQRHAVLFFIEQGLMPKTGKRYEWEVGRASGIPLSGLIQDFDWADEVLHAQIGREWYVKEFKDLNEAMSYGDRCWSQVLSHWRDDRDQGLTEHRNWWPEIYRAACKQWGIAPDPNALTFDTTYESTRADLKEINTTDKLR